MTWYTRCWQHMHQVHHQALAEGKGAAGIAPERVTAAVDLLQAAGARLWCLGTNRDGSPKHPLYIKRDQPLVEWQPPAPLQR